MITGGGGGQAASVLALLAASGCPLNADAWTPFFEDAARAAGLIHSFPNGGPTRDRPTKKYIIETTGSGAALIDYDNDGDLDAFVLSGEGGTSRLYHNAGGSPAGPKFVDATREAGIETSGWAQGICAGDYDNDGFTDVAITFWGSSVLFRNIGGARFENVTKRVKLETGPNRYNTGCAFLDYDRDGDLDLFVANYLRFDFATSPLPGANPYCYYREVPVNCGPRGLPFDRNQLFRNNGGARSGERTFIDVSESSGVARPARHYALSVLTGDFNNDAWPDIFVACDQTPSLLYINQRDGTFQEEALLRGAALDEHGKALSGMGATAADFDRDGWLDIFRTNFSDERETLYRNRGNGDFDDVTASAGLAHNTAFVGWGCGFFDFDNDGWRDLLLVNGHVFPEVDRLPGPVRYRQRSILYRNAGGKFADISMQAGPAVAADRTARGLAIGDVDSDGAPEVLVNNQNDTPALFRLRDRPPGNWILLQLSGSKSNRSAIGARVSVTVNGRTQIDEVRSGSSYLSQNDLRLRFGAGNVVRIERIEIAWPSGTRQRLDNQLVNRVLKIVEPTAGSPR